MARLEAMEAPDLEVSWPMWLRIGQGLQGLMDQHREHQHRQHRRLRAVEEGGEWEDEEEEGVGVQGAPVVYPDLLHTMHALSVWHTYEVGSLLAAVRNEETAFGPCVGKFQTSTSLNLLTEAFAPFFPPSVVVWCWGSCFAEAGG